MDCGTLTDPANGNVSHTAGTTFGQTATYSCNTGYNLVGGSIRMCQATGVWSGNAPICQLMLLLHAIGVTPTLLRTSLTTALLLQLFAAVSSGRSVLPQTPADVQQVLLGPCVKIVR